jgi:iron complex outermembrane receptor protein
MEDLMLYASYGRGFKSGGFDMRGDAYIYPATVNGYDPELVDTYELGLKTTTAGGHLALSAAAFYSDYQDQQITSQIALPTVPPTIASFVDNAAGSKIQGVELESTLRFTESFSSTLQVGYIDAEFDDFVTYDPVTGTRRNLADLRGFQNTPKYVGSIAFTWKQSLGSHGELSFIPSASYRDKYQMFETAAPLLDQDSYTLVDASARYSPR